MENRPPKSNLTETKKDSLASTKNQTNLSAPETQSLQHRRIETYNTTRSHLVATQTKLGQSMAVSAESKTYTTYQKLKTN